MAEFPRVMTPAHVLLMLFPGFSGRVVLLMISHVLVGPCTCEFYIVAKMRRLLFNYILVIFNFGAGGGNRTPNHGVTNAVLYH